MRPLLVAIWCARVGSFRKTGNMRPTIGPLRGRDRHCYNWLKNKWRPPRGMHIDHEDLVSLANESASGLFVTLDREIASLKRQVSSPGRHFIPFASVQSSWYSSGSGKKNLAVVSLETRRGGLYQLGQDK